jgi:ketosteroid isomerase-like protein
MRSIARTPEELESLFEDALVVRDHDAVCDLFESGAVLVRGDEHPTRGGEGIAERALAMWTDGNSYIADPLRIIQSGEIALILARNGVNVAMRSRDCAWKYVIVLVFVEDEI